MLEKIGNGNSRNVYNFGDKYVLKISRVNIKKLFFKIKQFFIENDSEGIKSIFSDSTGILENYYEYKNSKITTQIAKVKFSIPGILNIQEKINGISEYYHFDNTKINQKDIDNLIFQVFPEVKFVMKKKRILILKEKYIIQLKRYNKGNISLEEAKLTEIEEFLNLNDNAEKLTKKENLLYSQYDDLFHTITGEKDYGIDENCNLLLLDGGNFLIGKILKEYNNKFFDLILQKGPWKN